MEVFQRVAIRAWRGFPTFQGEAPFLRWVLTIVRRETLRLQGSQSTRRHREISLDDLVETRPYALPRTPAPDEGGESVLPVVPELLPELVRAAVASGALTPSEATVVLTRLAHPEQSWDTLGAELGMRGVTCAVTHCRAIPKLRVFLFTHCLDIVGGTERVERAFAAALVDRLSPLSAEEAEVFRRLVLDRQQNYHKAGWRSALRAACSKVSQRLPSL